MSTLGICTTTFSSCAGVELFFLESAEGRGPFWGAPSAFFALPTPADAEKVVQVLLQQEELGAALPGGSAAAEATGSILEVGPVSMLALLPSSAAGQCWLPKLLAPSMNRGC